MEKKAPPDEVVAWGESFDNLLESKTGVLVFRDFLRSEYSEENILFWLACEEYKRIKSFQHMISMANSIYSKFVQVSAPREISIDFETREGIAENISQPNCNIFNRAQSFIYGLMANGCYPRFLESDMYLSLLEQSEEL